MWDAFSDRSTQRAAAHKTVEEYYNEVLALKKVSAEFKATFTNVKNTLVLRMVLTLVVR